MAPVRVKTGIKCSVKRLASLTATSRTGVRGLRKK